MQRKLWPVCTFAEAHSHEISCAGWRFVYRLCETRALTPLFGNGAGAHGIGKISGVLTENGKFDIILMYDDSIARMIPIIKLTLVYYEKRERKKQVLL